MASSEAFVSLTSSSFHGSFSICKTQAAKCTVPPTSRTRVAPRVFAMADGEKKGLLGLFSRGDADNTKAAPEKKVAPAENVSAGQAGAKKGAKKMPVVVGESKVSNVQRGLALLRDDLLKSAPEKIGVGRQDTTVTMAPVFGEPGYKPQAYETARASELGISPFPDDPNAVGKVGGLAAVKKAAREAKKGKTAKELKAAALKKPVVVKEESVGLPSYLLPLPEDTPRKGLTWKNYDGR